MAFVLHMNLRHNLSKTLQIIGKLADINILPKQQVRYLPRWVSRRPIRIVNEDSKSEEINHIEKLNIERESVLHMTPKKPIKTESGQPLCKKENTYKNMTNYTNPLEYKTKNEKKKERKEEVKMNKLMESAARSGVPLYIKLPDDDPKLSKLMLIAKSKNKKVKRSHIVLEGRRLIKDAVEAGFVPEQVFFSRVSDAANLGLPEHIKLYKVSYKTIEMWSDVTTSPGIMGFLKTPDVDKLRPVKNALPLTVVCDNIRDPGNLGTIIRGAAGVGCQKVILTKGCVDPWEPKVLRSGAGAHFRTSVVSDVKWEDLESHMDDEASVFLADSNALSPLPDHLAAQSYEKSLNSIPVVPYFAVDYSNCGPVVLVIGGETEGLSTDAFKFAKERTGVRLNIPLSNEVDSLNSGVAFGVITFEMKRQFLSKRVKENTEELEVKAHGV